MKLKVRARLKGGPGSGHWGHAGRPGKVGGSTSGMGARRKINKRYWTVGPGRKILADLSGDEKQEIIKFVDDNNIQAYQLSGLKRIITDEDGFIDWKHPGNDNYPEGMSVGGWYNDVTDTMSLKSSDTGEIGVHSIFNEYTFLHELGHHVDTTVIDDVGGTVMDTMAEIVMRSSGVNHWQGDNYKNISFEQHVELTRWGLRPYSMIGIAEFMADVYKVYAKQGYTASVNRRLWDKSIGQLTSFNRKGFQTYALFGSKVFDMPANQIREHTWWHAGLPPNVMDWGLTEVFDSESRPADYREGM